MKSLNTLAGLFLLITAPISSAVERPNIIFVHQIFYKTLQMYRNDINNNTKQNNNNMNNFDNLIINNININTTLNENLQ